MFWRVLTAPCYKQYKDIPSSDFFFKEINWTDEMYIMDTMYSMYMYKLQKLFP